MQPAPLLDRVPQNLVDLFDEMTAPIFACDSWLAKQSRADQERYRARHSRADEERRRAARQARAGATPYALAAAPQGKAVAVVFAVVRTSRGVHLIRALVIADEDKIEEAIAKAIGESVNTAELHMNTVEHMQCVQRPRLHGPAP